LSAISAWVPKAHLALGPITIHIPRQMLVSSISKKVTAQYLEGIQNAIDELLLQPAVYVSGSQPAHDLLNGLHDHLAVLLVLVLQVVHEAVDNLRGADPVGNLDGGVDQLAIVAPVQRHPMVPEMLEEVGQDVVLDVLGLHAVRAAALLHHLQHDLLHLLVGGLELADEDEHHLSCVVVGVLGIHQGNQISNSLKKKEEK
jgi:hypothetical protein